MRKTIVDTSDRHLQLRGNTYYYKRRVPLTVAEIDPRAPFVRVSLKTNDLAIARKKRDALESADHSLWAAMVTGDGVDAAQARYAAAVKRVEAMGFTYMAAGELAETKDVSTILSRIEAIMDGNAPREVARAVLGHYERPKMTITKAFTLYVDEITRAGTRGKSRNQKQTWFKIKNRAVANFVELVGDKAMEDVTRDDAKLFYRLWLDRVAPAKGEATHTASTGNRDLGNMRELFKSYFAHQGNADRDNPFEGLSFPESKDRSRPPFSTAWISKNLLSGNSLASLNAEARGVVLAMVETGCRPSELCNLGPDTIILDHEAPHILIMPRTDPKAPREIKTASSVRQVPLVGVALAVFQKHRGGFPRYVDRENSMTTAINKFMRENRMMPSPAHSLYSLRHSFEDRMKEAGIDDELRRGLMGHSIDRPRYGTGGSIEWKRAELMKIALPFEPSVL